MLLEENQNIMRKLLICPFFGEFPEWMGKYVKEAQHLKESGYDFLIETDLDSFKKRVKDKLGIDCPIISGTGKVWDYRAALGYLYEKELKGYDFWGFTDFDCVYTDFPNEFMPDALLNEYDIISNHDTYICGCWSLFRNKPEVNKLFMTHPNWRDFLNTPDVNAWVEKEFSILVENSGIKYIYLFLQGNPWAKRVNVEKTNGRLYQDGGEIFMFHFRLTKVWPLKEKI